MRLNVDIFLFESVDIYEYSYVFNMMNKLMYLNMNIFSICRLNI